MWQRDRSWSGPIAPQQVAYIVESLGLDPVGPPLRTGRLIVQRATDDFGRVMRVTVDVNNGRVVSVAPAAAPPPVNGGPYEAYRPYGPGPYARTLPDDDDEREFAPPGSVMGPRAGVPSGTVPPSYGPVPSHPPAVIEGPRPSAKSATVSPGKPPVPRKRPQGAETAKKAEPGSVSPLQAAPTPAAPAEGTPMPPANAMPPVAPLE
jgi:hypothetical protein